MAIQFKLNKNRMTRNQILKLRPVFKFGNLRLVDWFEITEGDGFVYIRSGLKHADGVTKSPYYYVDYTTGKLARKIAFEKFTEWWNSLEKEE